MIYAVSVAVGYRHADGKKEAGEHNIGESHEILAPRRMLEPVGNALHFPEAVYKNHYKDGESAEHVYRRVTSQEAFLTFNVRLHNRL